MCLDRGQREESDSSLLPSLSCVCMCVCGVHVCVWCGHGVWCVWCVWCVHGVCVVCAHVHIGICVCINVNVHECQLPCMYICMYS